MKQTIMQMRHLTNREVFKRVSVMLIVCLGLVVTAAAQKKREPIPYNFRAAAALVASLESQNGQYLLNLTNNTERELRGIARLSLGTDSALKELGQIAVLVPASETKLYLLKGVSVQGEFYALRIYDGDGSLTFYKVGNVRRVTDAVLTQAESVAVAADGTPTASTNPTPTASETPAVTQPVTGNDIQVKTRISAGAAPEDPFLIAFEMSSQRVLYDATLQVTVGMAQMTKPVSINRHAVIEFNMPPEVGDGKVVYKLLRKDGSVVVQGETTLNKLMAEDVVTISDIRSDKNVYAPGEFARLTFVLEGSSKEGYRLEIAAHDAQDAQFFATTIYGKGGDNSGEQVLALNLSADSKDRVVIKYKIFDAVNNALFDSGERELTIVEKP